MHSFCFRSHYFMYGNYTFPFSENYLFLSIHYSWTTFYALQSPFSKVYVTQHTLQLNCLLHLAIPHLKGTCYCFLNLYMKQNVVNVQRLWTWFPTCNYCNFCRRLHNCLPLQNMHYTYTFQYVNIIFHGLLRLQKFLCMGPCLASSNSHFLDMRMSQPPQSKIRTLQYCHVPHCSSY